MIFTDFKLGDRKLSDFGSVSCNSDGVGKVNMLPTLNQRTNDIYNKNGMVYKGTNAKERTWTEYIYVENSNFDFLMFKSWLYNDGEEQQFGYVGDDKVIDVVCTNISDLEVYNNLQYICEVEFTAYNPFWRVEHETNVIKTTIEVGVDYRITQWGNAESEPWIYITPTTTAVKFKWNDLEVTLSGLDGKKILINCETEEVFEIGGVMTSIMNKYSSNEWYDFPKLNPYDLNTFTLLEGGISRLEIQLNSRMI